MLLLYSLQIDGMYGRKRKGNKLNGSDDHTVDVESGKAWNQNKYSGEMTAHAAKRCKKAINTLLAAAEWKTAMNFKTGKEFRFKLNFITLTLPAPQGEISDKTIKKEVLDVFIKSARRKWKLKSYIWKAERQANRNLHFHLTTDTYIPYDQLRDTWNHCLERLGYISKFEQVHGHRNPNSTDVHATKGIKYLRNYFVKYFTKGAPTVEKVIASPPFAKPEITLKPIKPGAPFKRILTNEESKIDGKTWDCSQNLKLKDRAEIEVTAKNHKSLNTLMDLVPDRVKSTDHCTMIFLTNEERRNLVPPEWNVTFDKWIERIRNYDRADKQDVSETNTGPPVPTECTSQEKSSVPF